MKQIYIDSNVIIRLYIKNVEKQVLQAQKLIKSIEEKKQYGLLSVLVINEIIWILENYYDLERKEFMPWILKLLALKNIKIVEVKKELIIKILEKMQTQKFDFTDIYLAHIAGPKNIFSFDRDFEKIS